ncbi:MAG: patatin-like phospholipase family protein, partial [Dongiaceae bacterium]
MTPNQPDHGPFSLAKVLEEEYVALHGPLPAGSKALPAETDRLAAIYALIHSLPRKRTALCLSGGGIRSATFGLGVLQGLARLSLLRQFDYLSTVSGGGYIGSWLTAWIHRHPDGLTGVTHELRRRPTNTQDPEPKPFKWLRQYSNYLSPRLGLMSVDSWTLLGTYLRNLTLNWLVLVPLLATALMTPRLMVSLVRWNLSELGLPASLAAWMLIAGLVFGVISLAYLHTYRPSLESFRAQKIWTGFERQRWFLIAGLTPLLLAAFSLCMAYAWFRNAGSRLDQLALAGLGSRETFVLGGALIHGAGWLLSTLLLRRWRAVSRWLGGELLVIFWSGALGGLLLWSVLAETPSMVPVADFAEWYACFAVPGFLTMFLLTATVFVGVASRYTDDHDREWWGRSGAWTLIAATIWSALGSLVIFGPGLLSFMPTVIASVGGLSGV